MAPNSSNINWPRVVISSSISLFLVIVAFILSDYLKELFHFNPRSAANNFAFNFSFFFPLLIISFAFSLYALIVYIKIIRQNRQANQRTTLLQYLILLPAVPSLIVGGLVSLFIIIVFITSTLHRPAG